MLEYVQFYLIPHQLSGVARSGFQSGICIRVGWSLGCKFYYYVFFLSVQEHSCGQPLVLLYFVFIFKFKIPLIEVYRNFYLGENPRCIRQSLGAGFNSHICLCQLWGLWGTFPDSHMKSHFHLCQTHSIP